MDRKVISSTDAPDKSFPIVGIGASAGGLEALESFLRVLPKKFGVAIIFVQHLSAKHKNLLPELLRSRMADLTINEIEDEMGILPGQLYLCPPAKEIRVEKGVFKIASRIHQHVHLPIDEFFVSLADDAGERAIAVILSGAGTDGARGVQAVRRSGGTVFVQDPTAAEFSSMPLAAINTGQVDGVLSPQDIAREILKFHGSRAAAGDTETAFVSGVEWDPLYRLVYEKTGYRFNHYKQSVVGRRIKRRMSLRGLSSMEEYLEMLESHDSEAALLASDLMIGVTSFFRDRLAWKALHLDVTRKLVAQNDDSPIRVWTPACATGEESYSIAMMLQQELDLARRKRELQVFATDVNDRALEHAREGTYPVSITADVPADYVKKFFASSDNGLSLTVAKEIRQQIVFAKHDLLTDPPFSRLDLIICRNLLIYLEPDAQDKCISLFHYALKEGGFLFLGGAESPGKPGGLFIALAHKKCRVYRKTETQRETRTALAVPYAAERSPSSPLTRQTSTAEYRQPAIQAIQEALLEEHAPAAVAINEHYEILYHNGPTNRYLRQPRGIPTQNLLELLPKNLRNRLRGALYRAAQDGKPVSIRMRILDQDEQKRQISFRISKVRDDLFLIVFQEKAATLAEQSDATLLEAAAIEETAVRQLENELSLTREDLQSHIEQLKSLNEELQSSNEEFQAANEELETSREELQSLNEELITVNSQLQTKIEEEEEINNDLSNFLASTNIPTIFLNQQLRVKRFTPAMSRLITLIPGDVGRPIVDMSIEHLGPDLITDASAVLEQLTPVKKEIGINGSHYVRTTLPYRTTDNRIEGVVITYADITDLKQAERQVRESESNYRQLVQNANSAIVRWRRDGTITFFNEYAQAFFGYSAGEAVGKNVSLLMPDRESTGTDLTTLLQDIVAQPEKYANNVNENICRDGRRVWMAWTNKPIFDETGQVVEILAVGTDITERKHAEEALRESEQRVRVKLQSILSPEGDIGTLELADIIDVPAVQLLMDDFYELARIPMAIIDLKGRLLVGEGWQDICTKFHRVNPETCAHCIESDTVLSAGIPQGESKLYKCKNNMWDIATPIMVAGQHVGNVFSGQFFFEGERPDYDLFRKQAKQYGFDEKEYIAALEAVPHMSRKFLESAMSFFAKLAHTLSQLSYSNIELARSLAQRDALMEALHESEERSRAMFENALDAILVADPASEGKILSANPSARRMFGYSEQEFLEIDRAQMFDIDDPNLVSLLERREATGKATGELTFKRKGGSRFAGDLSTATFIDKSGRQLSVAIIRDITERKKAEEAMRRLAQFPEENPNPVLRVALDGTLLYANAPARDMLKAMAVTTNGALPGTILALVADASQQKRAVETELADNRGRTFWFGASQPAGEEYVNLYARDITERKRAEEVVQATLHRFYSVLSSMYAGLLLVTDEGRVEFANQVFCELFDLNESPADLIGLTSHEMMDKINKVYRHPDEAAARIKEITDRGEPVKGEEVAMRGMGALLRDFIPIRIRGKSYGRLWYHTDITALKRAEEALKKNLERLDIISSTASRLLASAEPQTIVESLCRRVMEHLDCHAFFNFLVDEERNCLRLNAYAGIPEETAREIRFLDFGVAVCGCAARDACRIVAENIPSTPDIRTELVKSFGIKAYACHPLFAQGRVIGTLSFGTKSRLTFTDDELSLMKTVADQVATAMERVRLLQAAQERADELEQRVRERTAEVTQACKNLEGEMAERAKVEQQLRQAQKMEAIGTLAGGIAHDFNNILAIIIGNAELAIDDVPEEIGVRHNLDQIFKAGIRGRNLVRQILTFSRKSDHEQKPLALAPLVKETFDLLRASFPSTIGLTLDLKTPNDAIFADATQIQQVLMNLSKNAADAMRRAGGHLHVTLTETLFADETLLPESDMRPGRYVTLAVRDTGHGMDEEVKKKLFEPFFTTKEKGQGTGMGLAVVYGIVKAHHGGITVESEPGRGSTFTVYLPCYESPAKPEQKTDSPTLGGTERILFVDDEEALVELAEHMLRRLGYDVVGKTDGAEALKIFAEQPGAFDLVVTDQTMPAMTGALLAGKLRAIRPDIPIILCTGYSDTVSPEAAKSMDIQAFLMKPLSRIEVAETIRRVLDRPEHLHSDQARIR